MRSTRHLFFFTVILDDFFFLSVSRVLNWRLGFVVFFCFFLALGCVDMCCLLIFAVDHGMLRAFAGLLRGEDAEVGFEEILEGIYQARKLDDQRWRGDVNRKDV